MQQQALTRMFCLVILVSAIFGVSESTAFGQAATSPYPPDPAGQEYVRTINRFSRDNDNGQARLGLARCLEIDPTYAPAYYTLGVFADNQGKWSDAQRYYERFIKYGLDSEKAPEIRERLITVRWNVLQDRFDDKMPAASVKTRPTALAPEAPSKIGQTWINSVGIKFTYIPAGEFSMGSPLAPAEIQRRYGGHVLWCKDERAHQVKISNPFLLGVYHVTQKQWKDVTGVSLSEFRNDANSATRPAENMTWKEAVIFCRILSEREGRNYRLPTEAEWEYACRAGSTTEFYFGDNAADLGKNAWFKDNSGFTTHPVGQYAPNAWGLYDMYGNAWQWCSDNYGVYPVGDATDPIGPAEGSDRVIRGGSYCFQPLHCRSAYRMYANPKDGGGITGFRVVLELP